MKIIYMIVGIIVLGIIGGGIFWYYNQLPKINVDSFENCLSAGYPIMESYPRQCKAPDGRNFSEYIGNELEKSDLIKISNPRPNQTIKSPLVITGEARGSWFFEADFSIKLYDGNNKEIAIAIGKARGEWMTEEFVPFESELLFSVPETENGFLIFEKDNPSGLPEHSDELIMPIKFDLSLAKDLMKVKVFFNNNRLDPEILCYKVFPVEREMLKTKAVARAAIEELLKGPTEKERLDGGYSTSLNAGVKIKKLIIENGTAEIDFDEQLRFQVGGSCRVSAIRAQITETLKQFSTVNEVIISINGRVEDILQP